VLTKDPGYKRLKLGGRSWVNNATYWIGSNHLLVVEVANYVERYRRFYFRDIQTILVQNSPARLGWNIGFGVVAGLLLMGLLASAFSGSRDNVSVTIWFAFFLLFAACLMINTLRGPSCSVHVRTAVQTQKLAGVSRWRKADALVTALTPLIHEAQSSMAAGNLPASPVEANIAADDPNLPPRIVS
jgi:hypothetical protein